MRRLKPRAVLPDQRNFGKEPPFRDPEDLGEPVVPLPEEISDLRFSLDVGFGGSMKEYGANRFVERPLGITADGRGKVVGGELYENFTNSNEVCFSPPGARSKFRYLLERNGVLRVRNKQGTDIASVKGVVKNETVSKDGEEMELVWQGTSGSGSKLSLFQSSTGLSTIEHEGVSDDIFVSCAYTRAEVLRGFFLKNDDTGN